MRASSDVCNSLYPSSISCENIPHACCTSSPCHERHCRGNGNMTYLREVRARRVVGGYCFPAHQPVNLREDALEGRVYAARVKRRSLVLSPSCFSSRQTREMRTGRARGDRCREGEDDDVSKDERSLVGTAVLGNPLYLEGQYRAL